MSFMHQFIHGMMDDLPFFDPSFGSGMPQRLGRQLSRQNKALTNIINDKEALKINLDVRQFSPDELSVKIVEDYIIVEGKHEERGDEHGLVSRHFIRRYRLPGKVDKAGLISNLSSDGILQIYAPKEPPSDEDEREIPITQTNLPAIQSQEGNEEETKDE
ncbi:hypothetical protein J6590_001325 [Homalodisca vitripennis]|nr:hypothetical protein J6590_001325 [Homalodisca vitripennis]